MYVYQDQYGWVLQPKTNSRVPYVRFWNDFQKTYKTRAAAESRMASIWAELDREHRAAISETAGECL